MSVTERQLFFRHVAQTSDFPMGLEIEKAEGVYMFDKNGKRYTDLISGIGVSAVGHRHPKVVEAIEAQLGRYMHLMVYGEFIQSPQVQLARALSDTLPPALNQVYFVNSGSEATEGAIKLAKRYTGKPDVISCVNAYHGSSQGALSACGAQYFKQNFRPLVPGFSHIRYGSFSDIDKVHASTAAVIVETIQGEAGVIEAGAEYLRALRQKCDDTETLLIFDEIQCGFGRTGKFWAFEHYNVTPDILLSAKGMGGGMPIGCFIGSSETMGVLKNDPILGHISTFGGHPVSSAASLAALRVIQQERLMEGISEKESLFRRLLVHPRIKGIRSRGLMMAVDFHSFDVLKPVIDRAVERGVITDWFLFNDAAMRIAPPLMIDEHQIREACEVLLGCMD